MFFFHFKNPILVQVHIKTYYAKYLPVFIKSVLYYTNPCIFSGDQDK
jgi:hypothetical protein